MLFHERIEHDDGAIVETVLCVFRRLFHHRGAASNTASSTAASASGRPGTTTSAAKAIIGIFKAFETAYAFSTVEQLMADFWPDVRTQRGGK